MADRERFELSFFCLTGKPLTISAPINKYRQNWWSMRRLHSPRKSCKDSSSLEHNAPFKILDAIFLSLT